MTPKPPHAGGEIDSWCTKCKMVLNHRIIAMKGEKPAKVECSTCSSHHTYRPNAPGTAVVGGVVVKKAGPKSTRGPTRAQQAQIDLEKTWEKATSGRPVGDFKRYSTAFTFDEGAIIHHTKFGDGVVTRVLDARKVEVLFRDGPKTLAQGMTD
jgi:hypothetical protein